MTVTTTLSPNATSARSRSLWSRITAPHPSITDIEQRRQSQLLSAVMIIFAALFVVTAARSFYFTFFMNDDNSSVLIVAIVEIVLSIPLFILNRNGRYNISARLFIVMAILLVFAFAAVDRTGPYWGVIIVLFTAIFASFLETVGVSLFVFLASFVLALFWSDPSPVYVIGFGAALVLTFKQSRERIEAERQKELRNANESLRESEATLEKRVIRRTEELNQSQESANLLARVGQRINAVNAYPDLLPAMIAEMGAQPFDITLNLYEGLDRRQATYLETIALVAANSTQSQPINRKLPVTADLLGVPHMLLIEDLDQVGDRLKPIADLYRQPGIKALYVITINIQDDVMGTLALLLPNVTAVSESTRALFERMTDLIAAALKRISLYNDQVRYAQELTEVDRIKSQFLTSMSHELRTPLNSILNFTDFMSMEMLGPVSDEQQDALHQVIDSGQHLLSLINDILDINKIQSGNLKLNIETNIDLTPEIQAAIQTTETLLQRKTVKLIVEVDPTLARITCDKRRIRQVLLNLLSNAAKFTEEGSISLRAQNVADTILFTVADTGPGVKQEDQGLLFQPFQQTETGIKHAGGTGLGLAISKALIDAHQGRIWFENTPGRGATFFVSLPIQPAVVITPKLASPVLVVAN
jgi:signal transduction histidine kinase